jgi:hypothetical protein
MAGSAAIDPFQAGVRCPRLHQRAVPREGLVAEQRLDLWSCHQRLHEQLDEVVVEDSMVVIGVAEFGRRPSVVGCKIGSLGLKPTNQQNSRLWGSCSAGTDGRHSKAYSLQMAGLSRSSA